MKILVLDILINQGNDSHNISKEVLKSIFDEYQKLAELEKSGAYAIRAYLMEQNGKPLNQYIYKYRLNKANRILYTYGKYLPYIREEDRDSLVLLAFTKHDDQGFYAKNKDFVSNHEYKPVEDLSPAIEVFEEDTDSFTKEDLLSINEILSRDYIQGHTLSVVSDEILANTELENLDKYLSNEQDQCIENFSLNPQPTLMLGGAGTGKTLVAIHILNNFRINNPGKKAAYFTQSKELLQRAKDLYNATKGQKIEDKTVSFLDINDYCIGKLRKERRGIFRYWQFEQFVADNYEVKQLIENENLDVLDVWAEIRGTIKGSMYSPLGVELGRQWSRLRTVDQQLFSNTTELIRKGYFKRSDNNEQKIMLNGDPQVIQTRINTDETLTKEQLKDLNTAVQYFSRFDSEITMLSKNDYIGLPDEYSVMPTEKRNAIWEVCNIYERNLTENNQYDDNDLARELCGSIDGIDKFDLVVVDEIQDYTEMQIYLLANLCKTGVKIVFAGDEHQNVNPTVFNEKRVKSLFKEKEQSLNTIYLRKNFRCQQFVVDLANNIAELRRIIIGSKGKESEIPSTSERLETKPYRLEYSLDNIRKIAEEVSKYPGAVLLVPDIATKEQIIDIIGRGQYEEDDHDYIFAVSEIKGMEYEYVVCCDLIAKHIKVWDAIFEDDEAKHNTRYRYYFNLLYVGITRTQKHLCIIDSKLSDHLEEKLDIRRVATFEPDELYFDTLSARLDDWLKMARQYEQSEKYEQAIQNFKKGCAPAEDIYRCEMKRAAQNNMFDIASKYAMLLEKYEEACDYADETKEQESLKALARLLANRETYNAQFRSNYGDLNTIIDGYFTDYSKSEVETIKQAVTECIAFNLWENAEAITMLVGDMDGKNEH